MGGVPWLFWGLSGLGLLSFFGELRVGRVLFRMFGVQGFRVEGLGVGAFRVLRVQGFCSPWWEGLQVSFPKFRV